MYKAVEIKKNVYWVGGIDWNLRNFHGYATPRGSTYNAYLIMDKKIVLVDTVKHYLSSEMIERIRSVVDPSKIDYVVSNHVEMDHSGSLPHIMNLAKNAVMITSPNGEKGLKMHYKCDWNLKAIENLEALNIGEYNLKFALMPMVHWPDSMATYIPEIKLLLPNDAFGQHMATTERFDDQVLGDVALEEAKKYYANIVLPYGAQVKKVLEVLSKLEFDMIAPSHGIIWRKNLKGIMDNYKIWADNQTEERAVIVYDTMWESTKILADTIADSFDNKGVPFKMFNLRITDVSDVMTEILTAKYICVGSPTLNNNLLPTVSGFLTYLKGLAPKNRKAIAFGSFGWGGQSVSQIEGILKECGFEVLKNIRVQYIPKKEELEKIKQELIKEVL